MGNYPANTNLKADRLLYTFLISLAIVAFVYFRFVNLRQSPGWYSDEGNHIDLAENWMQGRWQNYGVIGATDRPPMYMYTVSLAMRVFGVDISVARGVGAAANLICAALICWITWQKMGRKEGVLVVWVMAIAPWIVTFGRLGLTYNLMAPFFIFSLIAIYFYCLKPSPGWLAAAAVSASLALATDYLGILCGVTIGLVLLVKRPQAIAWFALLFLAVFILVLLPILMIDAHIFLSDMRNLFFSKGWEMSAPFPVIRILINYTELLRRESWILVAICGLFLIKDNLLRNILLTAVGLTLLMVTKAYAPVGVCLHYLMHLFPLFGLGIAVFLLHAYQFLKNLLTGQLTPLLKRFPKLPPALSGLTAALIVFSPLVWMFLVSFAMTTYNTNFLFTGDNELYLVDAESADEVRTYVAAHVNPDDLVLDSPVLIWGLPTKYRADFLTALAYTRQKQQTNIGLEKARFTMDLSLQKAKFVILDPLAEEFAPKVVPGMDKWLEEIHQWPVVFQAGQIKVYGK
jgi:4-amino-4-deoxy-L-arabinose transferase-like glycosyltransferase